MLSNKRDYRYSKRSSTGYKADEDFAASLLAYKFYVDTGKFPTPKLYNSYIGWFGGSEMEKYSFDNAVKKMAERYKRGQDPVNVKWRKIINEEKKSSSIPPNLRKRIEYGIKQNINDGIYVGAPRLPKSVENVAKHIAVPGAALFAAAAAGTVNAALGPVAGLAAAPAVYYTTQEYLQKGLDNYHPDEKLKVPDLYHKTLDIQKLQNAMANDPSFSLDAFNWDCLLSFSSAMISNWDLGLLASMPICLMASMRS